MACNTQDYWALDLSSGILKSRKSNVSETGLFPSSGEEGGRYLLCCVP
jgi:hypothetical protein